MLELWRAVGLPSSVPQKGRRHSTESKHQGREESNPNFCSDIQVPTWSVIVDKVRAEESLKHISVSLHQMKIGTSANQNIQIPNQLGDRAGRCLWLCAWFSNLSRFASLIEGQVCSQMILTKRVALKISQCHGEVHHLKSLRFYDSVVCNQPQAIELGRNTHHEPNVLRTSEKFFHYPFVVPKIIRNVVKIGLECQLNTTIITGLTF